MNQFKSPNCKHKFLSWKKFLTMKINLISQLEQYSENKLNELCWYLQITNFKEISLGLDVTISRVFRTEQIKNVKPCFNFIRFKGFIKERLRVSFNGEKFTHFSLFILHMNLKNI